MVEQRIPGLILTSLVVILALPAIAGGSPGCPPSFCPAVGADNPDGIARLTLFPGTNSVVTDNGPGDLDPACGVLRAANGPVPGGIYSTGNAFFTGTVRMESPTSALGFAGQLVVTDAVFSNPDSDAGGGVDFAITSPLPLACGEFFRQQGGLPTVFQVKVDGTMEVEDDGTAGSLTLAGTEELHVTGRALTFTMVTPVFSLPPAELGVSIFAPPPGTASPHQIHRALVGTGTYADGPGVIGLILGGELPAGELFRFPTSIEAHFGDVPPPTVPAGGGATTPLTVQKVDPSGASLLLNWDTESCEGAGTGHSLLYGHGFQLPSSPGEAFELAGAVCDLGPDPTFLWDDVPNGANPMLWWLVVAHGGNENEGSWGMDVFGNERIGSGPGGSSDECGMTTRAVAAMCEP